MERVRRALPGLLAENAQIGLSSACRRRLKWLGASKGARVRLVGPAALLSLLLLVFCSPGTFLVGVGQLRALPAHCASESIAGELVAKLCVRRVKEFFLASRKAERGAAFERAPLSFALATRRSRAKSASGARSPQLKQIET